MSDISRVAAVTDGCLSEYTYNEERNTGRHCTWVGGEEGEGFILHRRAGSCVGVHWCFIAWVGGLVYDDGIS